MRLAGAAATSMLKVALLAVRPPPAVSDQHTQTRPSLDISPILRTLLCLKHLRQPTCHFIAPVSSICRTAHCRISLLISNRRPLQCRISLLLRLPDCPAGLTQQLLRLILALALAPITHEAPTQRRFFEQLTREKGDRKDGGPFFFWIRLILDRFKHATF